MVDFLLIAITPPDPVIDEPERIADLLNEGFDYVHLRHPGMDAGEMAAILDRIPRRLHPRIRLHSNFSLLKRYSLAGVQLNHRNPLPPRDAASLTKSCHTLPELSGIDGYEYVTLSPVFPSLSKPGYLPSIPREEMIQAIKGRKVVALGGVTPQHLAGLKADGFRGAAMLGAIWKDAADPVRFRDNIKKIINNA